MNAVSLNEKELEWQQAAGYPEGTEEKPLSVGGSIAPRAILLKIPPGWSMGSHSHLHTELHYVLQGEYESMGEIYSIGTFRIIPKSVEHGPFQSKTGAKILVIYCNLND